MKTKIAETKEGRDAWLMSQGIDPDEFPNVPIRKEWEGFPIIKEYRKHQKHIAELNK